MDRANARYFECSPEPSDNPRPWAPYQRDDILLGAALGRMFWIARDLTEDAAYWFRGMARVIESVRAVAPKVEAWDDYRARWRGKMRRMKPMVEDEPICTTGVSREVLRARTDEEQARQNMALYGGPFPDQPKAPPGDGDSFRLRGYGFLGQWDAK